MVTEDLHTREYSHSNGNWGLTYKVTDFDEKNSDTDVTKYDVDVF